MAIINRLPLAILSPVAGTTKLQFLFYLRTKSDFIIYRERQNQQGEKELLKLIEGSDYTVQLSDPTYPTNPQTGTGYYPGGEVTLTNASLSGDRYILTTAVNAERSSNFLHESILSSADINSILDSVFIVFQQYRLLVDYFNPRYTINSAITDVDKKLPVLEKNGIWMKNSDGTKIESIDVRAASQGWQVKRLAFPQLATPYSVLDVSAFITIISPIHIRVEVNGRTLWYDENNLSTAEYTIDIPNKKINLVVPHTANIMVYNNYPVGGADYAYDDLSNVTTVAQSFYNLFAFHNPPTGMMVPYLGNVRPEGWILLLANDDTYIGNQQSNQNSLPANKASQALNLFKLLWDSFPEDYCPIRTSAGVIAPRGTSAESDWSLNRKLRLPDIRGRVPVAYSTKTHAYGEPPPPKGAPFGNVYGDSPFLNGILNGYKIISTNVEIGTGFKMIAKEPVTGDPVYMTLFGSNTWLYQPSIQTNYIIKL